MLIKPKTQSTHSQQLPACNRQIIISKPFCAYTRCRQTIKWLSWYFSPHATCLVKYCIKCGFELHIHIWTLDTFMKCYLSPRTTMYDLCTLSLSVRLFLAMFPVCLYLFLSMSEVFKICDKTEEFGLAPVTKWVSANEFYRRSVWGRVSNP